MSVSEASSTDWTPGAVSTSTEGTSVSPSLLERARNISAEHARLTAANAENYDLSVAKRIGALSPVTTALKEYEEAHDVHSCHSHRLGQY